MELPSQIFVFPEIAPGVAGVELTVTANVPAVDAPHALFAVSVIFPLVDDAVALILNVVDEPVHPAGNVHV